MGSFCLYASGAFDIVQHTFLSNSNCRGDVPWVESLQALGPSFDALDLDFAWRGA